MLHRVNNILIALTDHVLIHKAPSQILFILIFTIALWSRFHYSHFTGEETEVPECEVTHAKSHSLGEAELGVEPRSSKLKVCTLFKKKKKKRQLSLEITKNCKILSLKGNNRRHNFR